MKSFRRHFARVPRCSANSTIRIASSVTLGDARKGSPDREFGEKKGEETRKETNSDNKRQYDAETGRRCTARASGELHELHLGAPGTRCRGPPHSPHPLFGCSASFRRIDNLTSLLARATHRARFAATCAICVSYGRRVRHLECVLQDSPSQRTAWIQIARAPTARCGASIASCNFCAIFLRKISRVRSKMNRAGTVIFTIFVPLVGKRFMFFFFQKGSRWNRMEPISR